SLGANTILLPPDGYWSRLLREALPQTANQIGTSVHITAATPVLAMELLGSTVTNGAIAAVPAQGSVWELHPVPQPVNSRNGGVVTSWDRAASISVPSGALIQDPAI